MVEFLWIGSVLGASVGLVHGVYLYHQHAARVLAIGATVNRVTGSHYGLWTFLLWTIFGAYVLVFWSLGSVAWSVARLISWIRPSDRTA